MEKNSITLLEKSEKGRDVSRGDSLDSISSDSSNVEAQQKCLETSLANVSLQASHMRRCLDEGKLMDALRHCSLMLNDLRSGQLAPKSYYQLYMSVFDALGTLASYLYEAHMQGEQHLSDLYELVQYAGNIIPRLYMMITVGSVYMRVAKTLMEQGTVSVISPTNLSSRELGTESAQTAEATLTSPVHSPTALGEELDFKQVPSLKKLMKDMLEMSRGVQDPLRGLFLRYYLTTVTRDYLPTALEPSPHGTLMDSVVLILGNFNEMNKLWVRLQYQGSVRHRDRRTQERKELQLLVGSNLVRISELEIGSEAYAAVVLPSILNEVVACHDALAQEYLMEIIVQIFPDEYHLAALESTLPAVAMLEKDVNAEKIVVALLQRFATYAKNSPDSLINGGGSLFESFWSQLVLLVEQRAALTYGDIVKMLRSLLDLSLSLFDDKAEYTDRILCYLKALKLKGHRQTSPANSATNLENIAETQDELEEKASLEISSSVEGSKYRDWDTPGSAASLGLLLKRILVHYGSDKFLQAVISLPSSTATRLGGAYSWLHDCLPLRERKTLAHDFLEIYLDPYRGKPSGPDAPLGEKRCVLRSKGEVDYVFGEMLAVFLRDTAEFDSEDNALFEEVDWDDVSSSYAMIGSMLYTIVNSSEAAIDTSVCRVKRDSWEAQLSLLASAGRHVLASSDIPRRFVLPTVVEAMLQTLRQAVLLDDSLESVFGAVQTGISKALEFIETMSASGDLSLHSELSNTFASAFSLFNTESKVGTALTSHLPTYQTLSQKLEARLGPLVCLQSAPEMAAHLYVASVCVFDFLHYVVKRSKAQAEVASAASAPPGKVGQPEDPAALQGDEEGDADVALKEAPVPGNGRLTGFVGRLEALENFSYEFFVRGLLVFEECILDSKVQCFLLSHFINTLHSSRLFNAESYETLAGKLTLAASRLLKRPDQIVCLLRCALLYERVGASVSGPKKQVELYVKVLRLAESVVDKVLQCYLLVDVLEQMARATLHNHILEPFHVTKVVLATSDRLRVLLPFALPLQDEGGNDAVGVSVKTLLSHVRNFVSHVLFLRHEEAESELKQKIFGAAIAARERLSELQESSKVPSLLETRVARHYGSLDVSSLESIIRQADEILGSGMTRANDLSVAHLLKQTNELVSRKSVHIDSLVSLLSF